MGRPHLVVAIPTRVIPVWGEDSFAPVQRPVTAVGVGGAFGDFTSNPVSFPGLEIFFPLIMGKCPCFCTPCSPRPE